MALMAVVEPGQPCAQIFCLSKIPLANQMTEFHPPPLRWVNLGGREEDGTNTQDGNRRASGTHGGIRNAFLETPFRLAGVTADEWNCLRRESQQLWFILKPSQPSSASPPLFSDSRDSTRRRLDSLALRSVLTAADVNA